MSFYSGLYKTGDAGGIMVNGLENGSSISNSDQSFYIDFTLMLLGKT